MSDLVLGLDVGVASIGWVVVEDRDSGNTKAGPAESSPGLVRQHSGRIRAAGVRIFPEGVDRDQQGWEKSKNQSRRVARGMRRQIARRKRRRGWTRGLLAGVGLFPSDPQSLERLIAASPYELRRRALDERLHPHEI